LTKKVFFHLSSIFSILILLIPILQGESYPQNLPPRSFEKGVEALQKGDLKTAEEIFRAVLKSDPENPFAYFNLGSIFLMTRRIDLALTALNRAVDLKPDLVAAHLRLAEIYEGQGNLNEAVREYEEAYLYMTEAFPVEENTIRNRIENLDDTIYFRENWDRGVTSLRKGNYPEAEAAFREALTVQPNNSQAYNFLGIVLGIQNRFDEAIENFKTSLRIKPNLTDSRTRLAELYELKGDLLAAKAELEKALFFLEDREGPEAQSLEEKLNAIEDRIEVKSYVDRSLKELENNNIDGAIGTLQSLIKLDPNNALAYFNLGNLFAQKNRLDLAETAFKRAVEIQPNYIEAYQRLGQTYEIMRYFDRAKTQYQKAQALVQKNDRSGKELDGLIDRVQQQIQIADASARKVYQEGLELIQAGNVEGAIAKLEQAIFIHPEDPELHFKLGELYEQENKIDLAINEMLGVLEFNPNDAPAHQKLGLMYEKKGYFYQSFKKWQEADTISSSEETRSHLKSLTEKLSEIELQTAPLLKKATEEEGGGKWIAAIQTLKQALSLAPDDTRIRMKLALLYVKVGNTTDAYTELNTVSLQDPSEGEAQYHLGLLYFSAGQWEDAKRSFETALKAKKLSDTLRRNIQVDLERIKSKVRNETDAKRYFNRGSRYMAEQDYRTALEYFEKIVRLYPSDVRSLYLIGFSYENLGQDDQARKYYEKVLELNPMHIQANQRLGMLYEKEGSLEKAIEVYRKTLDFIPDKDSPDAVSVRGKLTPLEKRYVINLNQVVVGYDSNPSGASNPGGDLSSSLGVSFNYYLKKNRYLQIPIAFSTQNTAFLRTNTIFSSETVSITTTAVRDPYSLSFSYNFNLGISQGGLTGRDNTGALSFFRRGDTPSVLGFEYSYDNFYSYNRSTNDAIRQRVRLSAVQNWDVNTMSISYSYFDNGAKLNDQAYTSHGIGLSYSRMLFENLMRGSVSYNLEWKEFSNPDSYIQLIETRDAFRRNFLHTLTFTGIYFLQDNMSVGLSYTELRNQSNLPAVFIARPEQRLSGQAESLGRFSERTFNLFLNWTF